MNNEIKEIIEYFKDDIDYLEEALKYANFKGRYITIRDKECEYLRKLLDYITNLQEENEHIKVNNKETIDSFDETMKDIKDNLIARINRQECEIHNLKAKLEMYENGVYFSSENDELQQRIDKAIEYIKRHQQIYDIDGSEDNKIDEFNILAKPKTLLDILGGKDG